MTTMLLVSTGVILAVLVLTLIPKAPTPSAKAGIGLFSLAVLFAFVFASSFRYVGDDEVGVVIKAIGGRDLPEGQIIATKGEKGPQARVLAPGWHSGLWPVIFKLELRKQLQINDNEVGLILARDGKPLPEGTVFAPQWDDTNFKDMLDAEHFLTDGGGFKGPQTSVLRPGTYRFNHRLFEIRTVPVTNVQKATVGVVKSNVGDRADDGDGSPLELVDRGFRGIWNTPYYPSKLYLNPEAFEVTTISTEEKTVEYTKAEKTEAQREITVRSKDGFTFPVDVRIEYQIKPEDAPLVVAKFTDDGAALQRRLTSAVRAIFRNNAENENALDYVKLRSAQEAQCLTSLKDEMSQYGVTIKAVRIGDVGDQESLGELLKTQTDREIAVQEQLTFQEQQRAAEQRKALTRTEQEAEEEKRLATSDYQVRIAEKEKEQRIIAAQGEAEAIRIKADAQAQAFSMIAAQIGQGNAALIELLEIVGEKGVQITPRVMVVGDNASSGTSPETTALIGTMLDSMIDKNAQGARQSASRDEN